MNILYVIDKNSKLDLINVLQGDKATSLTVILYKKYVDVYVLLKKMQLLPNVLSNIISEYNEEIINVLINFTVVVWVSPRFISPELNMTITENEQKIFDGRIIIELWPKRWFLVFSDDSLHTYFDDIYFEIDSGEGLFIFNKFMSYYYGEPKYIDDGTWVVIVIIHNIILKINIYIHIQRLNVNF